MAQQSESHSGLIGKLRANLQVHEYKEFFWHGFGENGAKSQSQPTHSLVGRWSRSLFNPLFLKLFIRPGSWNKDVIFTDIGGPARNPANRHPRPYGKSSLLPAPISARQRSRRTPYAASSKPMSIEKSSIASNLPAGEAFLTRQREGQPTKCTPPVSGGLQASRCKDSRFSSNGAARRGTLRSSARPNRTCPVNPVLPVPARSRSCRGHRMCRVCRCPTR